MTSLPAQFADLEPFSAWCIPGENERYAKRLASTMDEIQAFYDAAFPRIQDSVAYLNKYELDELPDDAKNLLWLYYSLVTISFCVEAWHQPRVPDSGAAHITAVLEPAI